MIKLEYYRNRAGLSQDELAKKVNMTQQRISAYELGKREPDLETLKLFANFFGITVDELLGIENNDSLKDVRMASYNGVDVEGLSEKEIEEIKQFVEFVRNKNKK